MSLFATITEKSQIYFLKTKISFLPHTNKLTTLHWNVWALYEIYLNYFVSEKKVFKCIYYKRLLVCKINTSALVR